MSFPVNINLSNNACLKLDIFPHNTISDVKRMLCQKAGLSATSCDIIFSGKYLTDEILVEELCLGKGSVLHAHCGKSEASLAPPTKTAVVKYHYYIYCKKCEGLHAGKLRVRCILCLQGAIVLDQEPNSWDDVLLPERLTGNCTVCNQMKYAEFYFKCSNHDGEESAIPLRHIRPNTRHVECVTCLCDRSPVLVYPCKDRHVICVECFQAYGSECLDRRTFIHDPDVGYSLPCPVGCDNSLIKDAHHFYLLGKDQYERYKDFGAEECLLQTGGVICPQPGCGEGMIVDDTATSIHCHTCQFEFCRRCRLEVHTGECQENNTSPSMSQSGDVESERAMRCRWESQSFDTIQKTTKPCPNCTTRTEKDDGCMHMRCTRCKQDWCWLCESPWQRSCQGDHWFG